MTTKEATLRAIHEIEDDLRKQVQWFENEGRPFEAKRLQERVTYDMEMLRELGHCSGIENYSRYLTDVRRIHALTVYWISSPMTSLSSLTRATSVFRRYEPCMAVTVPGKPIL